MIQPCPYLCASEPRCEHYDSWKATESVVRCPKCGALGPSRATPEQAISDWNRVSAAALLNGRKDGGQTSVFDALDASYSGTLAIEQTLPGGGTRE